MLAVMYAFYKWSHYLKGVSIPTEVLTDHQNLTYFKKPQNLNRQQARWVMDLQDFNFVIKYILVIVDRFMKKLFFLPTNSTITSKGIATLQ